MTLETFKNNVIPELKELDGIYNVGTNDYDGETIEIYLEVEDATIDLRPMSGAIKRKLRELGFELKKGNVIEWTSPRKRKDRWGDVIVDTSYYMIDLQYIDTDLQTPTNEYFKDTYYVFDKYDYVGLSDRELENIFRKTFENVNNEEDHMNAIEAKIPGYSAYPLWKYEHSGIHYEPFQSCRWDSSLIGCIIIKKDSSKEVQEIISYMNELLEEEVA